MRETDWLIITSLSFLPGAYISYQQHYYSQSYGLIWTTFCSINYWRNPIHGTRRDFDLVTSKIAFFWYLYHGYFYVHSYGLLCYPNLAAILFLYYKSNTAFDSNDNIWLYYHMLFHILVGIQGYTITYYLPSIANP